MQPRAFVSLTCEVEYWPTDNFTSIELKLYRSTNKQNAGIHGENLDQPCFSIISEPSSSINNSRIFNCLYIIRYDVSDIGYYWCQVVVNNISLSPSPYGHIENAECNIFDFTCDLTDQPLCVHNVTKGVEAHAERNGSKSVCTLEDSETIITNTTTTTMMLDTNTVPTEVNNKNDSMTCSYLCFTRIIIIGVILPTMMLLLVLIVFLHKRRKNRGKFSIHCFVILTSSLILKGTPAGCKSSLSTTT